MPPLWRGKDGFHFPFEPCKSFGPEIFQQGLGSLGGLLGPEVPALWRRGNATQPPRPRTAKWATSPDIGKPSTVWIPRDDAWLHTPETFSMEIARRVLLGFKPGMLDAVFPHDGCSVSADY